jgi:hypothetical protein
MQTKSLNFTKSVIGKIVPPTKSRDIYKDTKEQGLILMVSYTGKKTFYVAQNIKITNSKKYYRKKLGDFNYLSISESRAMVSGLRAQISKGINPFDKK